jgi:hypothetical protein
MGLAYLDPISWQSSLRGRIKLGFACHLFNPYYGLYGPLFDVGSTGLFFNPYLAGIVLFIVTMPPGRLLGFNVPHSIF